MGSKQLTSSHWDANKLKSLQIKILDKMKGSKIMSKSFDNLWVIRSISHLHGFM